MKRPTLAACAYVALAGSAWIFLLGSPDPSPALHQQPLIFLIVLVGALLSRPHWRQLRHSQVWPAIASGLLLFGFPSLLLPLSQHVLPTLTRVTLLTLVPVGIVSVTAARESSGYDLPGMLGPALAGVAGACLLLPADLPLALRHPLPAAAMATTILLVAIGSYTVRAATVDLSTPEALILMLAPSLALMAAQAFLSHGVVASPSLRDLPVLLSGATEIALLAYLLKALPPIVVSARYLLVPLFTTLESLALLRPSISVRAIVGVALMIAGAVQLIRIGFRKQDSPTALL